MSSTQKSFPVFNEDLRQGDDLLVCAVLPDTVHRNTNPSFLNTHTQFLHYNEFMVINQHRETL